MKRQQIERNQTRFELPKCDRARAQVKTRLKYALSALVMMVTMFFTSCTIDDLAGTDAPITIPTEFANILLESDEINQEIPFTATTDWSITLEETTKAAPTWLTVSPMSGKAGDVTLKIAVEKNTVEKKRSSLVKINAGGEQYSITVIQNAGEPEVSAEAGFTINGVTKPLTGVTKVDFGNNSIDSKSFVFSCTRPQDDVTSGSLLKDILASEGQMKGIEWSGFFQSTNMTNIDLTQTPDPNNKFTFSFISDDTFYMTTYNTLKKRFEGQFCGSDSVMQELTLGSGTLTYNQTGDRVTIDLDMELSNGHTIALIYDGDVADMQLPIKVEELKIDKDSVSLEVGETEKVTVIEVLPENAENKEVRWMSYKESVATVDQEGNITAHKVGSAQICVRSTDGSNVQKVCMVEVTEKVEPTKEGITINGVTKPVTGLAKRMIELFNPDAPKALFFSGIRSQDYVEDGVIFGDMLISNQAEGAEWSGIFQSTNMTNVDLTQTPNPSDVFTLSFISDSLLYQISCNRDASGIDAKCCKVIGDWSELTIESGSLTYNLTGDKVTVDFHVMLSNGHSIGLVYDGDAPDMKIPIQVEEIKLDKDSMTLEVGETEKVTITEILPENATITKVSWKSYSEEVATVDKNGNVTAHKAGTATIQVGSLDGAYTRKMCYVTVTEEETEPDTDVDKALIKGYWEATALSGTYNNMPLSLDMLRSLGIAPVAFQFNENGTGTSPFTTGSANWSVKGDELTVSAVDMAMTLTIDDISERAMTLSSNSLALGTLGSATDVTISLVRSTPPFATIIVDSVSLNKSTLSIVEGKTATLVATINPSYATNKNVVWSTTDKSIATVEDGLVTAVKSGVVTITVTTEDGQKTASCEVTVVAPTGVNPPDISSGGEL